MELIRRIAFFEEWKETDKWLESIGKRMTIRNYEYYKFGDKWKPIIAKMRYEFNQSLLDIPIANKRIRIQELDGIKKNSLKRAKFNPAINALREIRHEVEGEHAGNIVQQFNQFNYQNLSIDEIDSKITELVKQIKERRRIQGASDEQETSNNVSDSETSSRETIQTE